MRNGDSPVLVTGAKGMLGSALGAELQSRNRPAVLLAHQDLDITDAEGVAEALGKFAGAGGVLVVNAAAYTNVEGAEANPALAHAVNGHGAGAVALTTGRLGLRLVHVSTDFVFNGQKDGPYDEDDRPDPINAYGRSKLAGEQAVVTGHPDALIVRTSWVYGPGGDNFPAKILKAARERAVLRVVADEVGSPTYTPDLAKAILDLCELRVTGLYHLAGWGSCSRYELARQTLSMAGFDTPIEAASAAEIGSNVSRPKNAVLDCTKAEQLGVRLPDWRRSLCRFMDSEILN